MRSQFDRNTKFNSNNNDFDSIDSHQAECALGVNRKTGRLQWCPGFTCCKFLIILPVIMLPITLVLILLIRMDGMMVAMKMAPSSSAIESNDVPNYFDGDIDDYSDDDDEMKRYSRCTAVKFGLSETTDIEERDLLKDIRTSFIPPDLVVIPPDCVAQNSLGEVMSLSGREEYENDYLLRRRRFSNSSNSAEDVEVETDNPIKLVAEPVSKISSMGFHFLSKSQSSKEHIRRTQAETMAKYMDLNADPCEDFYQFACGNWQKYNPIPKDKAGYDTFEMLRESLDLVLKDLLEEETKDITEIDDNFYTRSDIKATEQDLKNEEDDVQERVRLSKRIIGKREVLEHVLQRYKRTGRIRRQPQHQREGTIEISAEMKAKYLYKSCINSDILELRGVKPLLDLLDSLGGWPVLDPDWSDEGFDWLNLTAQLRLYNNDILIVEWIGPDIKNSDENIIQIDQTSLGLPTRDYFLQDINTKYLNAYKEFMGKVMHLLGASEKVALETAAEVLEFEKELASITSSSEERANVSMLYRRMTVKELHGKIPEIDWKRYLSIVQNRNVDELETIVIYACDYMENLVDLLAKTDSKLIANYLLWRFVRHRINNVDDRFQDTKQQFYNVLFGREQSPPRWKNCVGQVNSNMGMALGAMFVRKYFDENSKEDTLRMTHELQQAFREILNGTDWLDTPTKILAEEKVNSMSLKIGYPDFILSSQKLNEKYKGLKIHPDKYFENTLNVLRHTTRVEQQKLNEAVNKTIWQTAPAIVNAYYSRNKNQIMFPAGILQPPFYHRHFPRSLNYGGIGVVIGHELTHGFDDKGRLFDRNGNIHKWWSDEAINGFHQRARCLVSQYGNYTVSEVGVAIDGESTQGENIADNGGIRQAFHAYKNWLRRNKNANENESLPGLNLTGEQLFFLNFAQVWCGAMRPEATRNKLKTAVHSPGKFRVIGTLSNSNDFAREFNCPIGCSMNPEKKCSVW